MQPAQDEKVDLIFDFPPRSHAESTPISAIMTRDVFCVSPDATRSELMQLFLGKGISGVPVVDAEGRPLGVASKTDVLRGLGSEAADARAKDIMTPVTLAMPEHASIARAAALMAYERVHRIVVVGPRGDVVGLVSTIDVLRWLARDDGYAVP
jgi:CBS domain-containing protein